MPIEIEEPRDGFLRIRLEATLMTLADTAMYYLLLGMIGPVALAHATVTYWIPPEARSSSTPSR